MPTDPKTTNKLTKQQSLSGSAPTMLVLDIKLIETNSIVPSPTVSPTSISTPEVLTLDSDQETTMTTSASNESDLEGTASSISLISATGSTFGITTEPQMNSGTNALHEITDSLDDNEEDNSNSIVLVNHIHTFEHETEQTSATSTSTEPHEPWPEHPRQYLERIKDTVSKAEFGNILSKGSDPFHLAVLRIHMESFDFRRDPIDLALRKFLLDFHFPKEAQQIDRVLEAFASRYHTCNPHLFRSADVVYTIAFSLMLLHTDAHNKNVRYKMSKEQYVRQAKSIDGVNTIPADILEVLYDNITFLKFVYAEDELDVDGQRLNEALPSPGGSWFPRRRTASIQRTDSYTMIRHGSIAHLAPDLSDLIPFRWPYYWKGTIEMVDNVQINNQFTKAALSSVPGLKTRQASSQLSSGAISQHSTLGPRSFRSNTTGSADSEFKDILREQHQTIRQPTEKENDTDLEECVQIRVVKSGILSRKIDIENGKKSSVRGWRDLGIILSGSQLLFFTDLGWFQQQRASQVGFNPRAPPEVDGYFSTNNSEIGPPPMPQALISTLDSIAVVDSSYQKYPHVFRMVCPNGKQYLFRADSEHEMNDWMAKINYASAFKTAGVRLRNYRVSWAKDVIWIKDEQGRHQLRRRRPDPSTPSGPIDGRTQLIQAKLKDIDRQITTCSASLAAELRLARGLEVMIPLQNSTRQKIVQSATVVGKRLRHLMLERTKLDCFRTILERDLALVQSRGPVTSPVDRSFGLGILGDDQTGNTDNNRFSSGFQRARSDYSGQTYGDFNHPLPIQHEHQRNSRNGMSEHVDHVREEYFLDSTRISQSSNRSIKGTSQSNSNIAPELRRSQSGNSINDGDNTSSLKNADIPSVPVIIQAAIIEAARGNHNNFSGNSTMSSPDLNLFQNSQFPSGQSAIEPQAMTQPIANIESSAQGQPHSFLTPDSNNTQIPSRSRALSMPGQRPTMMPRTVSIYSSSSQTANRLRRIFEQGLNHFKINSNSTSRSSASSPPLSATPSAIGGSSLRTSTSFQIDMDDSHHDS